MPWGLVRESLGEAVRSRWLETEQGDGGVADFVHAGSWRLRLPKKLQPPAPAPRSAEVEVTPNELQDLADAIPSLLSASAGHDLAFRLGVALNSTAPEAVRQEVDDLLRQAIPKLKSDTRKADAGASPRGG